MARTTDDPKPHRIAARVNDEAFRLLREEARRQGVTVGEVMRGLIAGLKTRRSTDKRGRPKSR